MSEDRKELEGTETSYGICKHCGQVHHMQTSGPCTEEQLDEWATGMCDCSGAKAEKRRKETGEKAKTNIEKLFREHYPETADILRYATAAVIQYKIASITVDTGHGIKGKVTLTGKGKVRVEQIVSKKTSLEE